MENTPQITVEPKTEKALRAALRKVSTELLGGPNRWRKLLERGYLDEPKGDEKVNKEGKEYKGRVNRHYTKETLLARMLQMLAEKNAPKGA